MKVEFLSKINGGIQDGSIFNGYLFSFNPKGRCTVYETKKLEIQKNAEAEIFAQFDLDKKDLIVPHSKKKSSIKNAPAEAPAGADVSLLGEDLVDQSGGQGDKADDHKNDQHTKTHILQIINKSHRVNIEARSSFTQKIHNINLPSVSRRCSE